MMSELKPEEKSFRGIVIAITEDGKMGAKLSKDIKPLEAYGALTLLKDTLRDDFEKTPKEAPNEAPKEG